MAALLAPEVVLLDIGLPDLGGLEVARRLRAAAPGPAVIMISSRDADYGMRVALGLARGFIPKSDLSSEAALAMAVE